VTFTLQIDGDSKLQMYHKAQAGCSGAGTQLWTQQPRGHSNFPSPEFRRRSMG
jgi:hypothetical protein